MTDVVQEYGLDGLPVAVVLVALFAIVFARSHLTYWAGRGVARGAAYEGRRRHGPAWWRRTVDRAARVAATPQARRGVALVHRWGPFAVTLAYVTVGVQTAVFVGSGVARMPYGRFTLASIPGSAAWAVAWGTVGLGAVWGAVTLAAGSPWGLLVLAAALTAVALAVVTLRRRRRADAALVDVEPATGPPED